MEGTAQQIIQWLFNQDKGKRFEIKEIRNRRSLDANKYAWALINEIANVMRISKEECYLKMLKDYGQMEFVSVKSDIDVRGYFKYYEEAGRTFLQDKWFTHYKVYKGSSEFDTREMSILIDGIVQEANALGIQTATPADIKKMKENWDAKHNHK